MFYFFLSDWGASCPHHSVFPSVLKVFGFLKALKIFGPLKAAKVFCPLKAAKAAKAAKIDILYPLRTPWPPS